MKTHFQNMFALELPQPTCSVVLVQNFGRPAMPRFSLFSRYFNDLAESARIRCVICYIESLER